MIGKDKKFYWLESNAFVFPKHCKISELGIDNEREFIEFLLRNDWIQRRIGIKMNGSNGLFPDIIGQIYDDKAGQIKVEVELKAENYAKHRHPFKGCHLILSFLRQPEVRFIKGIPVWSFYEVDGEFAYFCLDDDMNYDFDNHYFEH